MVAAISWQGPRLQVLPDRTGKARPAMKRRQRDPNSRGAFGWSKAADKRPARRRWKVFREANDDWIEEYAMHHRKDGLLVKEGEDAISASRYALMARRYCQSSAGRASFNRTINYPKNTSCV
jgi:hypothetical protein